MDFYLCRPLPPKFDPGYLRCNKVLLVLVAEYSPKSSFSLNMPSCLPPKQELTQVWGDRLLLTTAAKASFFKLSPTCKHIEGSSGSSTRAYYQVSRIIRNERKRRKWRTLAFLMAKSKIPFSGFSFPTSIEDVISNGESSCGGA